MNVGLTFMLAQDILTDSSPGCTNSVGSVAMAVVDCQSLAKNESSFGIVCVNSTSFQRSGNESDLTNRSSLFRYVSTCFRPTGRASLRKKFLHSFIEAGAGYFWYYETLFLAVRVNKVRSYILKEETSVILFHPYT